jgi:predicted dehydrogenase
VLVADSSEHVTTRLRRLGHYTRLDGPSAAIRKARTRLRGVGQFARLFKVTFSCSEIVDDQGTVHRGHWRGEALGELIEMDGLYDLASWHYDVAPSRKAAPDIGRRSARQEPLHNRNGDAQPRVAVVGAGAFVSNVIVPSIQRASGRVVAIADASRIRARKAASTLGIPFVLNGPDDLLQDWRRLGIDGVVVACAHSAHNRLAKDLSQAGIPLMVEKPIALNEAEIDGICSASDRAPIWVGHNRRHSKSFEVLSQNAEHSGWHLDAMVESFPLHEYHWYRAPGQGGRHLGNLTHWLDLAVALAGEEPYERAVQSLARAGLQVVLRFPAGNTATIRLLDTGRRIVGGREVIRLTSKTESIAIEDWGARILHETEVRTRTRVGLRDRGHSREYARWVRSLRAGATDRLAEAIPAHSLAVWAASST